MKVVTSRMKEAVNKAIKGAGFNNLIPITSMIGIKLSDGKLAVIKYGKGLDLLNAQKKAKTSDEIPYALIAELTEIDGNYLVYEDILELPIEDVILLQEAIGGKLQSKASA